jgi:proteic killer suppression protein
VQIYFKDDDLRGLCQDPKVMQKKLGAPCATKLRARLADLMAAASMTEVKRGRPHPLKGDLSGCMALDLHGGNRLVIEPADNPVPSNADGSTNWSSVTSVTIVYIGDYHG